MKFESHHDYFISQGNGRRQVHASTLNYKPDFVAWMPHKAELIDKKQPLTSMYRDNFHRGVGKTASPHQQLYSHSIASQAPRIRTKLDAKDNQAIFSDGYPPDNQTHFTTTYKKIHGTRDPKHSDAQEINMICYQSANSQRIERAKSVGPAGRESVASCLSWARPRTTGKQLMLQHDYQSHHCVHVIGQT